MHNRFRAQSHPAHQWGETCPSFPGTKVTLPRHLFRGNVTHNYFSALNARVRKASLTLALPPTFTVGAAICPVPVIVSFLPVECVSAT